MQYPLISEYVDAIRSAEDNFDKLNFLRPVLDGNGNPVMSSGNFAVVFKMKSERDGRFYALKCFTKEQTERAESYRLIADELEFVQSTYLAKVNYYDKELFVDTQSSDDNEFPVLLMDWVDGITLGEYIRQNIHDGYAIKVLAYNFSSMAMWLLPQPFAHGDLKPDNILMRPDGSLTLVDYDGMFVPAMQGQRSRELGSPDFRHPLRTEDDFNEHIDDFPAVSILLSLRLIAENPDLIDIHGAADRLLFSESDYRDLSSCALLKSVFPSANADINTLIALFTIACTHKTLSHVSFRLLAVEKPKKSEITEEELSTKVTKEDLANAVEDEFGVKYSKDGKRLLKGVDNIKTYKIKEGTKVICDNAFFTFFGKYSLQSIDIPQGITTIGCSAFWGCSSLRSVKIPQGVTTIGRSAFWGCSSLRSVNIPQGVTTIGHSAFLGCSLLRSVKIPQGVTTIDDYAFSECKSLQTIQIPASVESIGNNPFCKCKCNIKNLSPYFKVENNVLYNSDMSILIAYLAKQTCFSIPQGVKTIGSSAFMGCSSLRSVKIPQGVITIDDYAFSGCKSLQTIQIPASVKSMTKNPFGGCKCNIENHSPYFKVKDNVLYNSDMSILIAYLAEQNHFSIPHGVTNIGDLAFEKCESLQSIDIPHGVINIGDSAFCECWSLQKITIPKGSRANFEKMLPLNKYKLVEV